MGSTPRALAQAGMALLAMYVVILLAVLWPLQLLAPAFQLRLGAQLINSGPIALIGLALLQLGGALDPGDRWLASLHRRAAALAVTVVLGFLLLIPLLASASLRQQQSQARGGAAELRRAEGQLRAFRSALAASDSPVALQQRFEALQGPYLDASDLAQPMPLLRVRVSALLDQLAGQLQQRRRQLPSADPLRLLPEILRTSLGALVLAAGFAALARRPGMEASLLEESLLLGTLGCHRRWHHLEAQGSGRRRATTPEQDYMRQLSAEADGQARPVDQEQPQRP